MGSLRDEISRRNATFCEYIRNGNVAGLATLYTEDARLMPANSPTVVGRENIKEFWGNTAQALGITDAVLTTVQLEGEGDKVTEYGEYTLKVQPEGQEAGEDVGKYIVLWKKTPEGWKLHWDMFSTNTPAP
jgi:ketosteroid isomerase-like protein